MHRSVVFLMVFFFTLMSTILVGVVSWMTGQGIFYTVIYSVATMWITGIVSQVLVLNLYQGVVKPLEEQRVQAKQEELKEELNLDAVEAIDDAIEQINVQTGARVPAPDLAPVVNQEQEVVKSEV